MFIIKGFCFLVGTRADAGLLFFLAIPVAVLSIVEDPSSSSSFSLYTLSDLPPLMVDGWKSFTRNVCELLPTAVAEGVQLDVASVLSLFRDRKTYAKKEENILQSSYPHPPPRSSTTQPYMISLSIPATDSAAASCISETTTRSSSQRMSGSGSPKRPVNRTYVER